LRKASVIGPPWAVGAGAGFWSERSLKLLAYFKGIDG